MSSWQADPPNQTSSSSFDISTKNRTSSTIAYQDASSAPGSKHDTSYSQPRNDHPTRDAKSSHPKSSHRSKASRGSASSKTGHKSTSAKKSKRAPSDTLISYLQDPTHTNPGYSTTYTQGLIYTYGFPEEPTAREELESEIVHEAQARMYGKVSQYRGDRRG